MKKSDKKQLPVGAQEANPILVVDSYARGISIGRADRGERRFELGIDGDGRDGLRGLRSRYVMQSGEPLGDLERHMARLSSRGELRGTTVVFGATTDPFHPFDEKFATSMKFLQIFEKYSPGKLVVQTRSPLIVIGLPILKNLKASTYVSIGIETALDEVRQRYTPQLPSIGERWKTVRALKRFGFKVGVQVGPILPYGDWRSDAESFAKDLVEVADFVSIQSIAQAARGARPNGTLAKMLSAERQFFWLRSDTHRPLHDAVSRLAPDKVFHPAEVPLINPQMALFGA